MSLRTENRRLVLSLYKTQEAPAQGCVGVFVLKYVEKRNIVKLWWNKEEVLTKWRTHENNC